MIISMYGLFKLLYFIMNRLIAIVTYKVVLQNMNEQIVTFNEKVNVSTD